MSLEENAPFYLHRTYISYYFLQLKWNTYDEKLCMSNGESLRMAENAGVC